jgi:hypothetical protein
MCRITHSTILMSTLVHIISAVLELHQSRTGRIADQVLAGVSSKLPQLIWITVLQRVCTTNEHSNAYVNWIV